MAEDNPMSAFDFFERIFCINLDRRRDRWIAVQNEFMKVGIQEKVERFPAIERKDGRLGIIRSTLELIKRAQKENLNNILIFEDDIKFLADSVHLQNATEQLKNLEWVLFYLGANTHSKLKRVGPCLFEAQECYSTHAIAYSKRSYDKILKKYENIIEKYDATGYVWFHQDILDVFLSNEIQSKGMCFLIYPLLVTQKIDYSDIEKKIVNPNYIESRYKINVG